MDRLKALWASGRAGRGLIVGLPIAGVAVVLVVVLVASQALPSTSLASPSPGPTSLASLPPGPTSAPSAGPSATPAVADPLLGMDGRFTILLLGSDYRPAHPGNRTDSIMIVSIAPDTGVVSVVSIPRDVARFPMPDGSIFNNRVNALYQATIRRVGRAKAGAEIRRIIGSALGVEIDAYAFIGMYGLVAMIDAIGGVDVTLAKTVYDPRYWVNNHTRGVTFPAGVNHLDGARALIFARTRKGDSDFQRARRQQLLVLAATKKVLSEGIAALPALLALGAKWIRTDLPLDRAADLFGLIGRADLDGAHHAVLGPPKYASPIPGTFEYTMNVEAVRELVARWFAPVPGSPLGPPASPAPSGLVSPAPSG